MNLISSWSDIWKAASENPSNKNLSLITHANFNMTEKIELIIWGSQQIVLIFHTASLAFRRERKSSKSLPTLPSSLSGETTLTPIVSWEHMGKKEENVLPFSLLPTQQPLGELHLQLSILMFTPTEMTKIYCLKWSSKSCMYIGISIVWSLTSENWLGVSVFRAKPCCIMLNNNNNNNVFVIKQCQAKLSVLLTA